MVQCTLLVSLRVHVAVQLDGFMLDGVEAIHRYGLALIKMFKKKIKSNCFETGEEFWGFLQEQHREGGWTFSGHDYVLVSLAADSIACYLRFRWD